MIIDTSSSSMNELYRYVRRCVHNFTIFDDAYIFSSTISRTQASMPIV